ncbi:hypothetical protein EBU94_02545 [bacterium]|nr:hypothetical protein [bacterium]
MKIEKLKENYDKICNKWIKAFCKKQEIEFDGWIGEPGEIASFCCQYFFNLSDIILDMTTNQDKWFILEWQNEDVEHNMLLEEREHINYRSYIKGLRHSMLKVENK